MATKVITSKAIVAHEPVQTLVANWSLEDVEIQGPGEAEVLVQIHAAGICHTDHLLTSVPANTFGVKYPKVAGHEGAGIVQAVGNSVKSVKPGDRVLLSFNSCSKCEQCKDSHPAYCDDFPVSNYSGRQGTMKIHGKEEAVWDGFFGQSSFAEYSVVSEKSLVNVEGLLESDDELKLFAPLGCGFQTGMGAIQYITNAGPSDVVMVLGVGAVGMGAIMTSQIRNCKAIIAVDRITSRLELAMKLGATHSINTSDPDFESLEKSIHKLLAGNVTVVIETTGVPKLIEESLECLYKRGKLVMIGVPPPDYQFSFSAVQHINTGRSVMGCIEGDCLPSRDIPQMIQWYREGRFPIDKFVQYYRADQHEEALASIHDGSVIKPVFLWT